MRTDLPCSDCGTSFHPPAARGRLPRKCAGCRVYPGTRARCRSCGAMCSARAKDRVCRACKRQPCATCGRLGKGTKYCSDACRAAAPRPPKRRTLPCAGCGRDFTTAVAATRYCSPDCAWTIGPCRTCGGLARHRPWLTARCAPCTLSAERARTRQKNAIRRGAACITGRRLTIDELGDRDGWRCHLCRRRVSPALRAPHPDSATFDHLIPVSFRGLDEPENLALAHLGCNVRRGAGGTVQLLLVG